MEPFERVHERGPEKRIGRMQSIRTLLTTRIPLWIVLIVFATSGAVVVGTFAYLRDAVYEYDLYLPATEAAALHLEYGPQPALENADFFAKTKAYFIEQGADFVEADLSSMMLRVYERGAVKLEVPILTKGKEGSWWETPAGLYQIELKKENHFSSIGRVYQPWSLVFQGNFFIHGWPYYPDGTDVASTYSGGCIRLSTADAAEVYALVSVGMPVLVHEKDFAPDSFEYKPAAPVVTAEAFLVADLQNNFVVLERDPGETLPIASLTKLMTALVATEYVHLEKEITITDEMRVSTSRPRLVTGESMSAYQLLYPLLLESSNEAAEALAAFLGEERFVSLMNKKVKALGMQNTRFEDPTGAGSGNVSTSEDLFNFLKYLYNNRRFILNISTGRVANTVYGSSVYADLGNFNVFGSDPAFMGGKTGKTTAAKETLVAIFEIKVQDTTRPIAIIVLGSENSAADAHALLEYVRKMYE